MGLSYIGLISCTVSIIDIATMDMLYCYYYYNINNDGLLWWACGVRVEILREIPCVGCVYILCGFLLFSLEWELY